MAARETDSFERGVVKLPERCRRCKKVKIEHVKKKQAILFEKCDY
jgi:hypothetical protein